MRKIGRIERMLLDFCTNKWSMEDSQTRGRCVGRLLKTKGAVVNQAIVGSNVWRCFHRRHPGAMREAKEWSRTVARLLAQFDAEDSAAAAMAAIQKVCA